MSFSRDRNPVGFLVGVSRRVVRDNPARKLLRRLLVRPERVSKRG